MIQPKIFDGKCWWCGSLDLSKEHKYKKSDIKREYYKDVKEGATINLGLYEISNLSKKGMPIQGPNSKVVKFKANLCQKCNNERSQEFDKSYDKLISFLKLNETKTLENPKISMRDIFGLNWRAEKEYFIKYFIKNLGCLLSEVNIEVPKNIIDFLDMKLNLPYLEIVISQSVDRKEYLDLVVNEMNPASWIGRSEVQYEYNQKTNVINFFHYELYYRSFSFYIKLEKNSNFFRNNFPKDTINLILYNEEPFRILNNKLKKNCT
jgi:hypothetical protein